MYLTIIMDVKSLKRAVKARIETCQDQMALSAAAVSRNGHAIVIPGLSDVGKTTLAAWLMSKGYRYLTDKLVFFPDASGKIDYFPGPMLLHDDIADTLLALLKIDKKLTQREHNKVIVPESALPGAIPDRINTVSLILYPHITFGADLSLAPLSSGQATAELMSSTLNARLLPKHGFAQVAELSRRIPACKVVYSDLEQFEGVLDFFIKLSIESDLSYDKLRRLTKALGGSQKTANRPVKAAPPASTTQSFPIPTATPKRKKRKLTIGMATYDDFDGVYFSVQAIRMYHPEVTEETEIIVVDNHPDGEASKPLKNLEQIPGYRYLPFQRFTATAVRDLIFREANADFVLCMDSHVMIYPGALAKLLDYYDQHPQTPDLLHGPMFSESLNSVLTHFKPTWGAGMYGQWALDERGKEPDNEPFEIQMQGLGLFSCRKEAWTGFNPRFSGFGGEEGYIHEKFRQQGGKVLCLPFLRWLHRFTRPAGVQYPLNWKDRIRNYYIGFTELGLDTEPVDTHFSEHLGRDAFAAIKDEIVAELNNPLSYFDAIYLVSTDSHLDIQHDLKQQLEAARIINRIRRISSTEISDNDEIDRAQLHRKAIEEAALFDLENVLIMETDVNKDSLSKMADTVNTLKKTDWSVFYPGLEQTSNSIPIALESFAHGPLPANIIAYHSRAFKKLLECLPGKFFSKAET